MSNTIEIVTFEINVSNARELYEKTEFSIADHIREAFYDSGCVQFTIDDIELELDLNTFFSDRDCNNGCFNVFICSNDTEENAVYKIENTINAKQRLLDHLNKLVDYMNENINITIPTDNYDNLMYNYSNECFYIKIGAQMPNMIKLKFECNQTIEDLTWL
jgi:hypothetical protein